MPLFIFRNTRCGCVGLVRGQPVDLLVAVHHVPQVQARAQLQVARLEAALEQQHRAAPAERAHALGLGQVEQREAVGAAQAVEDALDAVAVGVGLDHRPDPGVGRGARARAPGCAPAPSVWIRASIGRGMAVPFCAGCRRDPCAKPQGARAITRRPQKTARHSCSAPLPGAPRCARPDEKRFLHHHVGAVLQLAGRQRAVRRCRRTAAQPAARPSGSAPRWCRCSRCSTSCSRPSSAPSPTPCPRAR